jgi:hypothetical protein
MAWRSAARGPGRNGRTSVGNTYSPGRVSRRLDQESHTRQRRANVAMASSRVSSMPVAGPSAAGSTIHPVIDRSHCPCFGPFGMRVMTPTQASPLVTLTAFGFRMIVQDLTTDPGGAGEASAERRQLRHATTRSLVAPIHPGRA